MNDRSELIDVLRFVAIIFVFVNHLPDVLLFFDVSESFSDFLKCIYFDFTSPLLALISGFLLFKKTDHKNGSGKIELRILTRVKSLAISYLLWISIFFIVVNGFKYLGTNVFDSSILKKVQQISPQNFMKALIDTVNAKISLYQFWFLQNLILVVLLSSVLYHFYKSIYLCHFFYL